MEVQLKLELKEDVEEHNDEQVITVTHGLRPAAAMEAAATMAKDDWKAVFAPGQLQAGVRPKGAGMAAGAGVLGGAMLAAPPTSGPRASLPSWSIASRTSRP